MTKQLINTDANDILSRHGSHELETQIKKYIIGTSTISENKTAIHDSRLSDILEKIINCLPKIEFSDVLLADYDDDLSRYTQKSGFINIPKSLIVVVVIDKILQQAENLNINIRKKNGESYIYNGKFWEKFEIEVLKKFLYQSSIALGYLKSESKTAVFQELLIKTFWLNAELPRMQDNTNTLINLSNCTLEVTYNQVNLIPHSPDHFLLYQLNFCYEKNAVNSLFISYLNKVLPDTESQLVLQEWTGYLFIKNLKLEKCAILYGSGRNGKSVFFEILLALLGKNNVKTFSLKHLQEEHNRAALDGKILNYGSEINSGIDPDLFKQLASGEPVQARHKYGSPFELHNYARMMFNANELPKNVEHSDAFFRRFLIIHFDQTILENEIDIELSKKIINTELPGVLNWIIEGIKRLQINKRFSSCKKSQLLISSYKKDTDSVAIFLEENNYESDQYNSVLLKNLFNEFKMFQIECGHSKISDRTFSKRLRQLGIKVARGTDNKNFAFVCKTKK